MSTEIKNPFIQDYIQKKNLKFICCDENRGWGGFYVLEKGINYDIKILWVKPKQVLSLQSHKGNNIPGHSEIWTALSNVRIILEEDLHSLKMFDRAPGGIMTIPEGSLHTLANPFDKEDVYVCEVRISLQKEDSKTRENRIQRIYTKYPDPLVPLYPEDMLCHILDTPFNPTLSGHPLRLL